MVDLKINLAVHVEVDANDSIHAKWLHRCVPYDRRLGFRCDGRAERSRRSRVGGKASVQNALAMRTAKLQSGIHYAPPIKKCSVTEDEAYMRGASISARPHAGQFADAIIAKAIRFTRIADRQWLPF
jgi:hypothetical protein